MGMGTVAIDKSGYQNQGSMTRSIVAACELLTEMYTKLVLNAERFQVTIQIA